MNEPFVDRPRYWLTRLYLAGSVSVTCTTTIIETNGRVARALAIEGNVGSICLLFLLAIALVAWFDTVVNDLMPARYGFPRAERWRHVIHMLMALGLVSITAVVIKNSGFNTFLLRYWLDAGIACTVAFCDLFARHRVAQGLE